MSEKITDFILSCDKDVILFIDKVDKSSNNQLFLSFLGMLRNKYLLREVGKDYTFKIVILAGVHDIKQTAQIYDLDLVAYANDASHLCSSNKLKLRPDDEKKYNSPWNIAVNFNIDMNFSACEIESMLLDFMKNTNVEMDIKKISKELYYYTNGYPFLVSRLCQIIYEDIFNKENKNWSIDVVTLAVKLILKEQNTLFDDLIKNLEHNKDINNLVSKILLNNQRVLYNSDNPIIDLGLTYGIFRRDQETLQIHNKIFEQRIYNYLASKIETQSDIMTYNFRSNFIKENNELEMEKILRKYQAFMRKNYSNKDAAFIEREGRLLFLAFIKPIINGIGFDFKEAQISEEKRLDIVVTYDIYKYVIELKIWNGHKYHEKGLNQLHDYLEIQGLNRGYLVIYDFNKNKEYKEESIEMNGKEIYCIWI